MRWESAAAKAEAKSPQWKRDWTTVSGMEVPPLITADQAARIDPRRDVGIPGEFPYTRGIHPTGYRGKLWTMRQFAGFGTAEDTNRRFKYLLSQGQTGLSVAFHLPTLYGYDSDHLMSKGEVGKCGVAIDSLADMETLFDGIPLGEVTTSMTINSTAPMLFAMYLAVAEKQGVDVERQVSGTLQNDILKEYIAQKEYIYPPRPSMRLITDQFAFAATEVPRWNTISISGYHIREAGSTALQELAFTLRDGMEYVQYGVDAGLDIDKTSRFFWLAWEGAILQAKLQRSTQPIEDFRDVLFRLVGDLGTGEQRHDDRGMHVEREGSRRAALPQRLVSNGMAQKIPAQPAKNLRDRQLENPLLTQPVVILGDMARERRGQVIAQRQPLLVVVLEREHALVRPILVR